MLASLKMAMNILVVAMMASCIAGKTISRNRDPLPEENMNVVSGL